MAKEKEQTDLFASNDAHTEKVKGVSPEQIRVLNNTADTSESGGHVERSETSIWEKQIDTLVHKLYWLTAEEIAVVEKS